VPHSLRHEGKPLRSEVRSSSCAATPPPPLLPTSPKLAIADAYPSYSPGPLALKQPDIPITVPAMELLRKELTQLEERGHFDKTVDQVQATIDLLTKAKQRIANGAYFGSFTVSHPAYMSSTDPSKAAITMAGLRKPLKDSFDNITKEHKEHYFAHGRYSKALEKVKNSHLSQSMSRLTGPHRNLRTILHSQQRTMPSRPNHSS
jgi:hypothetical protein